LTTPRQRPIGAFRFLALVWHWASPYRGRTALCALATVVRAAFLLILPLFYQRIFDDVLGGDGDTGLLRELITMMAAAFVVTVLADLAMAWLGADLAARIMGDLRRRMYLHLQRLSESYYSRVHIGDLMSHFTNDLFSIDWAVSIGVVRTLFYTLITVASSALLFYFQWQLAIVTVVLLPLTLVGPRVLGPRALAASADRKRQESEVAKVLQEDIAGHRVIQAFGLQGLFYERFEGRLRQLFQAGLRANLAGAFLTKSSDIGVIIVQLLIVSVGA